MYKMVAFDIDGTLIRHLDNELSFEIKDMFKKLKEKGFIVVLATGRDFISIGNIYKNENIDYFIGANGSFIYDLKNKEYIFNSSISIDDFKKYNEEVIQQNLDKVRNIMLSDINNVFVLENEIKEEPWFWDEFRSKFRKYDEAINSIDLNNFHLITVEFSVNSSLYDISKNFLSKNDTNLSIQAHWPKGMFLANKFVNKAHSLKHLCRYLNIDIKDVIAFGDGENDKEMISEVGLGVAMGNASESLKKLANEITLDVSEYGTKIFLEKMGLI